MKLLFASTASRSGSALFVVLALLASACTGSSGETASGAAAGGVQSTEATPATGEGEPVLAVPADLPASLNSLPLDVWQGAGANVFRPSTVVLATDFGVIANDDLSDSAAINAAVSEARGIDGGAIVELPEGTLLLTDTINLYSNIVLRGQGPATRLELDLGGVSGIGVSAVGSANDAEWLPLDRDVALGEREVHAAGLLPEIGDLLEIEQDNDNPSMVTKPEWDVEWGRGSEGEMVIAAATAADGAIALSRPLVSAYTTERNAKVRLIRAARNVGVEDLSIVRLDEGYGHSIRFRYATDIWVDNVVSTNTSRAHVAAEQVANCTITGGIFHDATNFGDGGRAYGISLSRHTTACLVFNNTLYELRHAIIIQLGASGNVIAYNHARGSAGYEDRRPRADLSLHGHWPQQNLFEGNIFDRIEIGDWWGPAGPGNTFLRNCVLDHVILLDGSNDQHFLLNVIDGDGISADPTIRRIGLTGDATSVTGDAAVTSLPVEIASLWRSQPPEILGSTWPPIQPSQGTPSCDLPASRRSPLGNR